MKLSVRLDDMARHYAPVGSGYVIDVLRDQKNALGFEELSKRTIVFSKARDPFSLTTEFLAEADALTPRYYFGGI